MNETCDVVVIGGGSAGVAAAVAAARSGARVILIERYGYLGGAGTASLVHTFCGLYRLDENLKTANPGLPTELPLRLIAEGVAQAPVKMGRVHVLPHHPMKLAAWYDRFTGETDGLNVWFHSEVVSSRVDAARLVEIECVSRGVRRTITASAFVDASGDAVLAQYAEQEWTQVSSDQLQRPAFIATLQGVDQSILHADGPIRLAGEIAQAVRAEKLPLDCLGAHFRGSQHAGEVFVTVDLPGGDASSVFDPLSVTSLSRLETTGRAIVQALIAQIPQLQNAHVSAWPIRAGIRESRRWIGRYELTEEDLMSSARFDDGVAAASWPMELRETTRGPRLLCPLASTSADIPLRSLRTARLDNVFTAGRCISTSHRAQASTRVMGTALATGQAAGLAAAFFASSADDESLVTQVKKALNQGPSD